MNDKNRNSDILLIHLLALLLKILIGQYGYSGIYLINKVRMILQNMAIMKLKDIGWN
jgi:hypothetical protein